MRCRLMQEIWILPYGGLIPVMRSWGAGLGKGFGFSVKGYALLPTRPRACREKP